MKRPEVRHRGDAAVLGIALLLAVAPAGALSATTVEEGTIVAVQGLLTVDRPEGAREGTIGMSVQAGDRLSTDATARARIVLAGDSVLEVGPDTELLLDRLGAHPRRGREVVLQLSQGAVRVRVGTAFAERDARFEVETPTAVVAARGADAVVRFYPEAAVTEVLTVAGEAGVAGRLAVLGGAVQVTAQQYTQVRRGGVPTAPELLSEGRQRQYLEGLSVLGTGRRDALHVGHRALTGRLDRPDDLPRGPAGGTDATAGAPREFLGDRLSQDVRTNTQPLLDFERTPPGQVPAGSVVVGY